MKTSLGENFWTRLYAAFIEPPVAKRSSCIKITSSFAMEFSCISISSKPYSFSYFSLFVSPGILPFLRHITSPAFNFSARIAAIIMPRVSTPTIFVIPLFLYLQTSSSLNSFMTPASVKRKFMSLYWIPFFGKLGIFLRCPSTYFSFIIRLFECLV